MNVNFPKRHLLLAACLLFPTGVFALTLAPGTSISPTGTTVAAEPQLAQANILDNLITGSVSPSGNSFFSVGSSIQNRVGESQVNGNLIFGPRIRNPFNVTTGDFYIEQAVITGYGNFDLDVDYRLDGLGTRGPTEVSRSADGDELTLDFGIPLLISYLSPNPQETSLFMSIETETQYYSLDGTLTIYGRHDGYPGEIFSISYDGIAVPDFAPVPIPASLGFMLTWLGLGGVYMKRRKSKVAA